MYEHTDPTKRQQSRNPQSSSAGAYNPITLADLRQPGKDGTENSASFFAQLGLSERGRTLLLSAPFLLLIYGLAEGAQFFAPIVIIVLLGCLLFRMDDKSRKLAAVPLIFGAFRLVANLAALFGSGGGSSQGAWGWRATQWETCLGLPWVPMLLAAGLLYAPVKDAVTTKIMYWESTSMLIAGLIPGQGYIGVFCVIHYTLFIAIVVGLAVDLGKNNLWSAGPLTGSNERNPS